MASIAAELRALPLEYVIASPMKGAIKAQAMAAKSTLDFINQIGIKKTASSTEVNMVDFVYSKNSGFGNMGTSKNTLSVPLLSMVPVPFIRIKNLDIHFDFKIATTDVKEEIDNESIQVDAKYVGWMTEVDIQGTFSSTSTHKSTVDKSAILTVDVKAVQDEIPEGLRTVLNIFNDVIKEQSGETKPGIPDKDEE